MSGPARVGFDNSRGTTDSHYASVTNQAGIYAGDGGYNVQVDNSTTLTGGIIKGSPDKSRNKLSSNSLIMNDIQNEASYSAKTSGYSLSTTKRTKNNPIGITGSPKMGIPVKGSAKSTTHSAISEGVIEIAEKESLEKINHDTEQALNKLAPIFDKKTVEEKQILLNKISEHGYKLIGDVSAHQQTILLDKAVKAKMKGENAKADKYYQESKKWGDNGIYKVSLHASLGGFLSNYSGSNIISGVKASGVNESLQSLINKSTNPEFRKIISLVIGKVVSGDIGGALAEKATTYNWLEHQNRQDLNYDISQLLFTNAYGYDEDTRWSKLREKVAYYYALMEYERDYHDYYDSDNLVHATDGGHIGEPYYTDESYSALLNNLFAYVVGSDPDNINYYTHLKEYYYNKFVSEEKYIQDKGYNVRTYDAGWQESDGQYYNKLINGGTVLNGRFRGKQLELEGYPTVLGDDGQTHYTLDENGRPWYNPNPSESSINRIVWQGYQDTDGQFFNVLADGRKVLTGEYKGNYNAKAGLAIEFDRDTRTFSSGGFPIFPDGDKELLRLTSWVEFKADLNYAGETGMIIAGGNSLGRGVLPRGVKAGNSRQNSGNVIRYAREYPKTEKGYYGTSSKGSGKAFVREIPGGEQEARKFFETISKGGKIKPTNNPDNIMKEMPDGRIIQFRPKSKSGDAAVDISESEAGPRQKIHFPE
jgi:filamentous hemagglutinin family outer membrane protein